jgi:hypothetical protein
MTPKLAASAGTANYQDTQVSKTPGLQLTLPIESSALAWYYQDVGGTGEVTMVQAVILTCDRTNGRQAELFSELDELNPIIYRDRGEGAAIGTKKALWEALIHSSGTDRDIAFFEDDVVPHPCAAHTVLCTVLPPDVGVMSFCDMRELPEGTVPGQYEVSAMGIDGRGFWGNQALLIRRDVAVILASTDWFSEEIEALPGVQAHKCLWPKDLKALNCSDIRMSYIVHTMGLRYCVYVPSLFEHVGHVSACFPRVGLGERTTRNLKPRSNPWMSEAKALRLGY